ncbi:MAG: helix-turn-helix transcriptional regulator [Acidobacteriota bacterium]
MDVSLLIRQRLKELGLDQKDLAAAAGVTDSYISQLLSRKKAPPAPGRTGMYQKIGKILRLPTGELEHLAEAQRKEELRKKIADAPRPLFQASRALVLRKCAADRRVEIQRIFEKEPFGELERLVTQKLLDVAQKVAREDPRNKRRRAASREFLDSDVYNVSAESAARFLDPIIESWDFDLKTFAIDVTLHKQFTGARRKRFEFAEQTAPEPNDAEPGLQQFLRDPALSGDATPAEIGFLKALRFQGRRPSPIYYYRELQNLRDPLHFPPGANQPGMQ